MEKKKWFFDNFCTGSTREYKFLFLFADYQFFEDFGERAEFIFCGVSQKLSKNRKNEVWFGYTNKEEKSHAEAVSVNKTYYYPAGTNQFVALYLISALYYSNLEFCERVEIIYKEKHTTTNLEITRRYTYKVVRNNIIREMYREYEAWFKNLNGTSLSESPPPLEDSKFRWD